MAMLIQSMSAKLGIATGMNLPEVCRERFPRAVSFGLWIQAEVIAMATDLAEFIGAAIGINLLFGLPLFPAALVTGAATFGILALQAYGFRRLEAVIAALVGVIVVAFGLQVFLAEPVGLRHRARVRARLRGQGERAAGGRHSRRHGHAARHLPALGADAEAHRRSDPRGAEAHVPLRADRCRDGDGPGGPDQHEHADHGGSHLLLARARLVGDDLSQVYAGLEEYLGTGAAVMFAFALLASGLSSSSVGTMAGQVVMQGFVNWQIPLTLRRGITMLPALVVIAVGIDPTGRS